jgi:hypothetical protein
LNAEFAGTNPLKIVNDIRQKKIAKYFLANTSRSKSRLEALSMVKSE